MTTPHSYHITWPWYIPNIFIHLISTQYIPLIFPLESHYIPIISLLHSHYIASYILSFVGCVSQLTFFFGGPGLGLPFFKGGRPASSRAVAFSGSRDRWSPGRRCPGMEHGIFSDKTQQFGSYFYGVSLCCCGFWMFLGDHHLERRVTLQKSPGLWSFGEIHVGITLRFGCEDSWVFTSTYLNDFYFWKVLFHKVDQDFLCEAWTIQKKVGLFFHREYSKCVLLKKIILKYSIMQYRDPNVVLHQFLFFV